jgi:hypothetical protein
MLSVIPPVAVVAIVLGLLVVSLVAVAFPPPFRSFPRILLAGVVGSLLGHLVAAQFNLGDPLYGDAHLAGIGAGSLLVSSIVRRFSA